jgi:hypothetical protein
MKEKLQRNIVLLGHFLLSHFLNTSVVQCIPAGWQILRDGQLGVQNVRSVNAGGTQLILMVSLIVFLVQRFAPVDVGIVAAGWTQLLLAGGDGMAKRHRAHHRRTAVPGRWYTD